MLELLKYEWLRAVLQRVKPWMSSTSIDKGSRSANEISDALRSVKVGIVCLTPENLLSPWLLFEAGAISNAVAQKSHVCTYLLGDLTPAQIEKPLGEFQHTIPEKEDTLKLLRTINSALGSSISDAVLTLSFEGLWPSFQEKLKTIPADGEAAIVKRESNDILAEILETTRAQADNMRVLHSLLTQIKTAQNRALHQNRFSAMSNAFTAGRIKGASIFAPGLAENAILQGATAINAANLPDISKALKEISAGLEALKEKEEDKKPKG